MGTVVSRRSLLVAHVDGIGPDAGAALAFGLLDDVRLEASVSLSDASERRQRSDEHRVRQAQKDHLHQSLRVGLQTPALLVVVGQLEQAHALARHGLVPQIHLRQMVLQVEIQRRDQDLDDGRGLGRPPLQIVGKILRHVWENSVVQQAAGDVLIHALTQLRVLVLAHSVPDLDAHSLVRLLEEHLVDPLDAIPGGVIRQEDSPEDVRERHLVREEGFERRLEHGDGEELRHEVEAAGHRHPPHVRRDLLLGVAPEPVHGLPAVVHLRVVHLPVQIHGAGIRPVLPLAIDPCQQTVRRVGRLEQVHVARRHGALAQKLQRPGQLPRRSLEGLAHRHGHGRAPLREQNHTLRQNAVEYHRRREGQLVPQAEERLPGDEFASGHVPALQVVVSEVADFVHAGAMQGRVLRHHGLPLGVGRDVLDAPAGVEGRQLGARAAGVLVHPSLALFRRVGEREASALGVLRGASQIRDEPLDVGREGLLLLAAEDVVERCGVREGARWGDEGGDFGEDEHRC
ncbi:hypothetical protein Mapa_014792 [Marchantia paleacea]|nr:hypothetical protein Mapa_014792 [Marchantia paleacea]